MSDEQDKLKLSLEAPKLFGRKKRPADTADSAAKDTPAPAKAAEASEPIDARADEAPAAKKAARTPAKKAAAKKPTPEPASPARKPAAEKVAGKKAAARKPAAKAPAAAVEEVEEVAASPTAATTAPDDTATTTVLPAVDPEPVEDVAEPELEAAPEPEVEPEPVPEPEVEVEVEVEAVLEVEPSTPVESELDTELDTDDDPEADPEPEPESAKPASRWSGMLARAGARDRKGADAEPETRVSGDTAVDVEPEPVSSLAAEDAEIAALAEQDEVDEGPLLTTYWAAVVTGLVVGAAMVFFTWLALRGCESVRDTSSCGGGPGFALLIITFALCVIIGRALLKAFELPDPGSSSFLAVGVVAVVALMFLIDIIDHWSMIIIVPILSMGGYAASVWVTKTFVEPANDS